MEDTEWRPVEGLAEKGGGLGKRDICGMGTRGVCVSRRFSWVGGL
ncbi:unnamed protein product, partial [Staurois parvus]